MTEPLPDSLLAALRVKPGGRRAHKMAEVARLYRAQWTTDTIAEKLRLAPRSVITYAHTLRLAGVDVPRGPQIGGGPGKINLAECAELRRKGWKQAALAARYGSTQTAVSEALRRAREAGLDAGPAGRWPRQTEGAEP